MTSRWLAIEVELLSGRYHGRSDGHAEWPPGPHRLFQALVAAGHSGGRRAAWNDSKSAAFRWLERQEPPLIVAPPATRSRPWTLSVPNNDADVTGKDAASKRTFKFMQSHLVADEARVVYLWRLAEADVEQDAHIALLVEEARHIACLGLGIDLAIGFGRVVHGGVRANFPRGEIWAPQPGRGSRAPAAGSYDEVEARFVALRGQNTTFGSEEVVRLAPPLRRFAEIAYKRLAEGVPRRSHTFSIVQHDGTFAAFDPRRAIEVAAWLRHAAHEASLELRASESFVRSFVCGHGEGDSDKSYRLSYLVAPTIGHPHADGLVRRVIIAEPFAQPHPVTAPLIRGLRARNLVDTDGVVRGTLRPVEEDDRVAMCFAGPSSRWATVTPVVLPGRDDRRRSKAVSLLVKAVAQAGLTTPVREVRVAREPIFTGQALATKYRVPSYAAQWPVVHAEIEFSEPVHGPISLGVGRHVGLGVLAVLGARGEGY